jgi:hypothetical protein
MIVRIKQNQPELRVTMSEPGPSGQLLEDYRNVRLEISAPAIHPSSLDTVIKKRGCWPGYADDPELLPHELPTLIYPAFEVDCQGALVFRFDDKLHRRPRGRYIGRLKYKGEIVWTIDIDLGSAIWLPVRIEYGEERVCS